MTQLKSSQTNRLLGYPGDARLLILNADDFGMCHSINEAILHTLRESLVRSTTLSEVLSDLDPRLPTMILRKNSQF
jgi:hypothetical protein